MTRPRQYRCTDRMCGATDCATCYPDNKQPANDIDSVDPVEPTAPDYDVDFDATSKQLRIRYT